MTTTVPKHGATVFWLPLWWRTLAIAVVTIPAVIALPLEVRNGDFALVAVLLAVNVFSLWCIHTGSQIHVFPSGIWMYRLWWLPWGDIREAKYYTVLGLPYVRVKRRRGFTWSIPLYYAGAKDLRQTIVGTAPAGNPLTLGI
jgi:hypothetical protein